MPPLPYLNLTKFLLIFILSTSTILFASSETQFHTKKVQARRMLNMEDEENHPINKITTTKKPNQTVSVTSKLKSSPKNQTKLKKTTNSTQKSNLLANSDLNNLKSISKPSSSISTKKTLILTKQKNQATNEKQTQPNLINQADEDDLATEFKDLPTRFQKTLILTNQKNQPTNKKQTQPDLLDLQDEDDLVTEFKDLPKNFQKTLIPDLEIFATASKTYLTNGIKPIIGTKYTSSIASTISIAFIIIPLFIVSLIFNRLNAHFSVQKLLIFIQFYLSVYFSILCFAALVTGLEPLRLFYATSEYTYIRLQVIQTLGYLMYLLLLCVYLVLVFSTDCGLGLKLLGLAQTFVGLGIGLHSYVSVFHRVMLHHPPKTSWKVHGIYAMCYLLICLFATAERSKKAYLEDGGEERNKS